MKEHNTRTGIVRQSTGNFHLAWSECDLWRKGSSMNFHDIAAIKILNNMMQLTTLSESSPIQYRENANRGQCHKYNE
jgi:hypothetical protein